MAEMLLNISPADLRLRFELRKPIPATLTLHNPTEDRVAFKVMTTSPKKYFVRPSSGIVEAGAKREVQVIMQAQREYPPNMSDCEDKFRVQAIKIDLSVREVTNDTFDTTKAADIRHQKLRVVLVGPPKPPIANATPGRPGLWRRHPVARGATPFIPLSFGVYSTKQSSVQPALCAAICCEDWWCKASLCRLVKSCGALMQGTAYGAGSNQQSGCLVDDITHGCGVNSPTRESVETPTSNTLV